MMDWPERRKTRLRRSTPTRSVWVSAAGPAGASDMPAPVAVGWAAPSMAMPADSGSGVCTSTLSSRIQLTQSSMRCRLATAWAGAASSPCKCATMCCSTPTQCCMSRTAAGLTGWPAFTHSSAHSITSSRRCAVRPIPGRPMMLPDPLKVWAIRCASIICGPVA